MANILTIVDTKDRMESSSPTELKISGFGSIRSANIKIAPLTILVGRNNTGKSYIASLLWAIRSLGSVLPRSKNSENTFVPDWFKDYVKSAHNSKQLTPLEISGAEISNSLNIWLIDNKNKIVKDILTYNLAIIEELQLSFDGKIWLFPERSLPKAFEDLKHWDQGEIRSWRFSWENKIRKVSDADGVHMLLGGARDISEDAEDLYICLIQKFLLKGITGRSGAATYVPAARTGLMLSLSALYESLIESFGLGKANEDRGKFSLPTIQFLKQITRDRSNSKGPHSDVADFIEKNVLKGEVYRESTGVTGFVYKPSGSESMLPLHVVSSMVSELTPLLTLLRHAYLHHGLIFEEPEAHLHLSAQRWMARAIAILVNRGVPVVLTTHSDTFLQQINLLVQLKSHPDRSNLSQRFGYSEEELLDFEKIEAYQFVHQEGGTIVSEVAKGADGLIVPSLNMTLYSLAEEALALDI